MDAEIHFKEESDVKYENGTNMLHVNVSDCHILLAENIEGKVEDESNTMSTELELLYQEHTFEEILEDINIETKLPLVEEVILKNESYNEDALDNCFDNSKIPNIAVKPFECEICKRNYSSRSRLQIHMRVHTGEKPFECSVCKQKYADKRCFRRHMNLHPELSDSEEVRYLLSLVKNAMKVSLLKKLDFNSLNYQEKWDIVNCEPPRPNLSITQTIPSYKLKNPYIRKFASGVYFKHKWLCGCEETNRLFCFICLLYGGNDSWTEEGVDDLKHITIKIRKHENSVKHLENAFSFKLLRNQSNITQCVSSAYAESIHKHNEKVKNNREALSKIIDILKFCGARNLPLRGQDESHDSSNKDVFLELMDYTERLDPALKSQLENSPAFKGTSKTIQDELLDCMLQVCREYICNEIKDSLFLACMADDITDVSAQAQTVIVCRYELKGKVHERFWGFFNPESQNASGLSKCILNELQNVLGNCNEKLVAQTYDGAAVIRGSLGAMKVKQIYNNAHYVYCYAHQLDKLVEQAASQVPSARVFFLSLCGIPKFFSCSPDHNAALNEVCKKIPSPSNINCNFDYRVVQTVFENKDALLECLENIEMGTVKKYSAVTVTQAAGFVRMLNDEIFLFWLDFFNKIMPLVEILDKQLQKIHTDPIKIQNALNDFQTAVSEMKNNLPPQFNSELNDQDYSRPPKRRKHHDSLNTAAKEVCDIIIVQLKDRFQFTNHLAGTKLFDHEKFKEYNKTLPWKDINNFCSAYPMINKETLSTQLKIFYSRPELKTIDYDLSGCLKILNFLNSFELDETFVEIARILKLLVTIPMITAETERCFSTLKLIKNFLKNNMDQDKERLTAIGMLSIEKRLVLEIPQFNKKVIEKFCADKERREDFNYKQ